MQHHMKEKNFITQINILTKQRILNTIHSLLYKFHAL